MELIRGFHNFRPRHRGCVATIGAFDGVHRGHQAVLRQLIDKSREYGLPSTVVLFEPLPREFLAPDAAPPRLMSFREKFEAIRDLGIDRVVRIRFNNALRNMSADEFITSLFVKNLGAKYIVVGDDLRFGRDRSGDFDLLRKYGARDGFDVMDTATLLHEGERVSSTRIREVLGQGDFALAEHLLGRPYSIAGRVIVGQQLGRTIGAPTANIQLRRLRSPLSGVFAVQVAGVSDSLLPAVANVGVRPTVGDLSKAILEVHLLDFEGDLYRRNIRVLFREKLRNEIKFDGIDALSEQISRDIAQARRFFSL
ncbi:MAG: bifunctional riboflavin kinase/FMN adenylyltransferase [Spongiibacter sp.]|jgi:riboflavin kinase/FMN adenylyltransferase|nr:MULTISPECIES: bifunctional riboflavin kinase/FAD synthetase [Spongiibacter]MAK45127.1 bifunctional riboflavin kinase/FMN adenylyltransferase [Spongiibacter sp.]MEE2653371.1 bifunctional riboflavin kinase/FAD synthetase [Pseudomonadota bacterium]|tara:strand:- start:614 stop:1543 length:930 start_codon:yes stop_codon:yes gene_type:complete